MRKIYTVIVIAFLISFKTLAQFGPPAGSIVTYNSNIANIDCIGISAFVIDNTGNKWIGFNNNGTPTRNSPQLMRLNGNIWDTFPHIPGKKVNALAIDPANNIWIGSNQGLVKYNGLSYTYYTAASSNIISDTILSLACGNGNVYIGTKHGLSVFNGTTFTNYNRSSNGMKSDSVYCIAVENTNVIWLGNEYGLDKFNGTNFSFFNVLNGTNDKVTCVYIDAQNNKWINTRTNGVIRYDNATFISVFNYIGGWATLQQLTCGTSGVSTTTASISVNSICKGPSGGVYISNGVQGLSVPFEVFNNGKVNLWQSVGSTFTQYDYTSNRLFWPTSVGTSTATVNYLDTTFYHGSTGGCDPTGDELLLDINNVSAIIFDNADAHWNRTLGLSGYSVPKQNNNKPLYASAFWMGGYNGTTLHTAAMTYRQNGVDFWPGPLDTINATIDTATMNAYSHVWKINRFDIANFIYNWNIGNVQNGTFIPNTTILNWPAQGLGNYSRKMAPYIDVNHNGIYDPIHDGDYPDIKGDQMIWHVFNDNFSTHGETGGGAFGIEVQASAYAFICPNIADSNMVLNNTTFYNYKIFNRSSSIFHDCYVAGWIDSDLGNYLDDYIGCDVMNNFGYTYNGDNYDEDAGSTTGYHDKLPAFACNVLNGPKAVAHDLLDNNNNGVIDEPNEKCLQGGFTYYVNSGSTLNGNPSSAFAYYNLMRGNLETGPHMTYGDVGLTAVSTTHPTCKYLFPGNSDPYGIGLGGSIASPVAPPINYGATGWTESSITGNNPGDRRFITNIGPFTMQPGGVYEVDWALVFSQDTVNCIGNNTCIFPRMVQDNKRVKNWFDNNSFPSCLSLVGVGIKQNVTPQVDFKLYPNPANNNIYVEFDASQKNATIEVFDMLGKVVCGFQYNNESKYVIIPVADLQSGMYMVKVKTNEAYTVKKFIKE